MKERVSISGGLGIILFRPSSKPQLFFKEYLLYVTQSDAFFFTGIRQIL